MNKFLPGLLLLCSAAGFATTVYKTVDENGVVSFSDTDPKGDAEAEVLQIATPPPQATDEYISNLDAMRETTDRMAEDRREREKHRAEMKDIAAKSQPKPVYSQGTSIYSGGYYDSGYYYPGGQRPWRPDQPERPEHPIVRPPLLPVDGVFRGANSQLMRPMLPRGR